jgi:hypothetical protein
MIRAAMLAFAAAVSLLPWSTQPAAAREAPWCAVLTTSEDSVYWDCQYYSIEQCRTVVLSGNRGWCNPSPYASAAPAPEEKRKVRKRHNS